MARFATRLLLTAALTGSCLAAAGCAGRDTNSTTNPNDVHNQPTVSTLTPTPAPSSTPSTGQSASGSP